VLGVAHFAPSIAPLAQTKPARTSSSAQRTLSVPVTTRIAGAGAGSPFGPACPAGPGGPTKPGGPGGPRSPAGPTGPWAPACPCGPCGPTGPGGPEGPAVPCSPTGPWAPACPCGPCGPTGPGGGRAGCSLLADGALRTDGPLLALSALRAGRTNWAGRASLTSRPWGTLRSRASRQRKHRYGSRNGRQPSHQHFTRGKKHSALTCRQRSSSDRLVTTSHIACLRPGAIARNPGYDGDDLIPILDFAANTFSRKTPMPVVGFLHAATPEAYAPTMAAFRKSLSEGYAEMRARRERPRCRRTAEQRYELATPHPSSRDQLSRDRIAR
jgi:hypothetical protein